MRTLDVSNMTGVHSSKACQGRGCVVHHPSDHHMNDRPVLWRGDRGIAERVCEHGIGHPDPDMMAYLLSVDPSYEWVGVHGCDGCCHA